MLLLAFESVLNLNNKHCHKSWCSLLWVSLTCPNFVAFMVNKLKLTIWIKSGFTCDCLLASLHGLMKSETVPRGVGWVNGILGWIAIGRPVGHCEPRGVLNQNLDSEVKFEQLPSRGMLGWTMDGSLLVAWLSCQVLQWWMLMDLFQDYCLAEEMKPCKPSSTF